KIHDRLKVLSDRRDSLTPVSPPAAFIPAGGTPIDSLSLQPIPRRAPVLPLDPPIDLPTRHLHPGHGLATGVPSQSVCPPTPPPSAPSLTPVVNPVTRRNSTASWP